MKSPHNKIREIIQYPTPISDFKEILISLSLSVRIFLKSLVWFCKGLIRKLRWTWILKTSFAILQIKKFQIAVVWFTLYSLQHINDYAKNIRNLVQKPSGFNQFKALTTTMQIFIVQKFATISHSLISFLKSPSKYITT